MSTFVLVHGAFRGGWAWSRLSPLLAAHGHRVEAPTLSPAAEGLGAWVDQVASLLVEQDLREVVLVGHSQGGVVVREVAVRLPERLRVLVYLDAAVPDAGERAIDVAPSAPDAALLPARDAMVAPRALTPGADLDAATARWVNERLVPTPFAPSLDPGSMLEPDVPAAYAFFAGTPAGYPCATTRARLDARGTAYDVLDGGHDAPLTRPEAVAGLLLRAATTTRKEETTA
ncbi:alpha/beta fold hydrolase [Nocardioides sp. cx-173]|uniref:alpha/beta fold hydrolase n=1 Tax=Nocardioides sp. cx-173 TaxID=2898796 RepID=UPI001E386F7A|nr:alpha/beta fold hydrolase [Nocardioides sp. cx-173]MCD4524375.1 alpha/beta hydrolase [Nocardioides sp. cx-173]UGB43137.1 alpha/beta hydrolase [Nocardioides sp. cx-173]